MSLINLQELKHHSRFPQAQNKYKLSEQADGTVVWFEKLFTDSSIVEIDNKNTIYILPAAYSQKHIKTDRQQYYQDLFINHRYSMDGTYYTLNKETTNRFDNTAISILWENPSITEHLHLGYIPTPLNLLVSKLIDQHEGDIRLQYVYLKIKMYKRYIAPIFKWEVNLPQVSPVTQRIRNRFVALMYDND